MSTIIVGDPTSPKPKLVLTHGYGSSAPTLYKLFATLEQHFTLYLFDHPGYGGSDRPQNFEKNSTPDECIDYFVEHIEAWRIGVGNITDFYLAGHSYGGHLTGHYAVKYPQHVRKLFLISPLGVPYFTEEQLQEYDDLDHFTQRGMHPPKGSRQLYNYNLMVTKLRPESIPRAFPFRLNEALQRGKIKNAYKITQEPDIEYLAQYSCQI